MGFYCSFFIRKSETTELVMEFFRALGDAGNYDFTQWDEYEFPDHLTVWRLNYHADGFVNKFLFLFDANDHLDEILESVHRIEPPNNAPSRYMEAAEDEVRCDEGLCPASHGYIKNTQHSWGSALLVFALIAWVIGEEIVIRTHDEGSRVGNYYSIVPPEQSKHLHSHEDLLHYLQRLDDEGLRPASQRYSYDPNDTNVPDTFEDKCCIFIDSLICGLT